MKLSTQIILTFSIVILLSIVDSYINYILTQKVDQNSRFLARSETIIRNSNRLNLAINEMQSAFRGFLLTEDTTFLNLYREGMVTIPTMLAEQVALNEGSRLQTAILDSIEQLHMQWINYSTMLINAKKSYIEGMSDARTYDQLFENRLKKQVGKKLNDRITEKFQDFNQREYEFRNVRADILKESINKTLTYSTIFLSLTIIIGIVSAYYIVRLISGRIHSMVSLAESISKGKFQVVEDTRNDELTGLSRSLNIMSENLSKNITQLENRNAELDKFAYVVSHDLKAPVRGIRNVIKWIDEDFGHELSKEVRDYLEIIPQRTKRMEDLINGLLEYARISEKSHVEDVDTHELVKEITDYIVPRHFTVDLLNLPHVHTERIKLEQVFSNLISNAVNFTKHDHGHIIVSCREMPDGFEFSVKDNGIGIDPEYHDKIFEIFQTLREKDDKESTGIGLAIIKKIIEEQKGRITVLSETGKGAEFRFTWPKTMKRKNEKA
jgi:signal transduction histidine kinase